MSAVSVSPQPLGVAEFTAHLSPLHPSDRLAVAFSGGPDSLALLWLAARWARRSRKRDLVAFTVDHGLRAESAGEARLAARMAKSLGVRHRILVWHGQKPKAGLQASARAARYRLLIEACKADGISDLLVAHHLEDQAETFLLRLARGSGVDGLSAMANVRDLDGIRLLRPLLDVPRGRLAATLAKAKLQFISDPSNVNERFDRVKARRLLAELAPLGLDAARLAATAGHMARVRSALETETRALLADHATLTQTGHIEVAAPGLFAAPEEIGLRALAEILKWVGATAYPPRFDALHALYLALKDDSSMLTRTLNGCRISRKGGTILVIRELAAALVAAPLRLRPGESGIWDGRFALTLTHAATGSGTIEVRALGAVGLAGLKGRGASMPNAPKAALPALPALWRGGRLLAAPHFGMFYGKTNVEIDVWPSGLFKRGDGS